MSSTVYRRRNGLGFTIYRRNAGRNGTVMGCHGGLGRMLFCSMEIGLSAIIETDGSIKSMRTNTTMRETISLWSYGAHIFTRLETPSLLIHSISILHLALASFLAGQQTTPFRK